MTPQYNYTDDLWDSKADVIAVTTNGQIGVNGLMMGGGSALQAKQRFPFLPRAAGNAIERGWGHGRMFPDWKLYGWLYMGDNLEGYAPGASKYRIGLFQTKGLIKYPSLLALIGYSTMKLYEWWLRYPTTTVALAFPGIGHGKLTPEAVRPILDILPPTVTIYGNKLP